MTLLPTVLSLGMVLLAPPAARLAGRAPAPLMQTMRNSQRGGDYRQKTGAWPADPATTASLLDNRDQPRDAKPDKKKEGGGKGKASKPSSGKAGKRSKEVLNQRAAVGRALSKVNSLPDTASTAEIQLALADAGRGALTARDYTTILSALRSDRKWRMALRLGELLASQPPADTAVAAADEAADGAAEAAAAVPEPTKLPNLLHYNAMLAACADAGRRREPEAGAAACMLLDKMMERGVAPDARSFASAIAALDASKSAVQLTALLAQYEAAAGIRAAETPADAAAAATQAGASFVYSAAMRASLRAKAWEQALGMLDGMRAAGLVPDSYCLAAGIEACRQGRDGERALKEMRAAREAGGAAAWSAVLVSSAMGACVRSGKWAEALALFDEHAADLRAAADEAATADADAVAASVPVAPDDFCFAAALAACRRGAQAERALSLLSQFESAARAGGGATAQPANRPGGVGDGGVSTRAHLREQAVGACVAAGQYSEAIRCHAEAEAISTSRSLVFALQACGSLGVSTGAGAEYADTAVRLHQRQPTAGILGQTETDAALLSALAACGAWPRLLTSYDGLSFQAKASKECLMLAAQAAKTAGSPRAVELLALADKAGK